jgi:hypothetical protein
MATPSAFHPGGGFVAPDKPQAAGEYTWIYWTVGVAGFVVVLLVLLMVTQSLRNSFEQAAPPPAPGGGTNIAAAPQTPSPAAVSPPSAQAANPAPASAVSPTSPISSPVPAPTPPPVTPVATWPLAPDPPPSGEGVYYSYRSSQPETVRLPPRSKPTIFDISTGSFERSSQRELYPSRLNHEVLVVRTAYQPHTEIWNVLTRKKLGELDLPLGFALAEATVDGRYVLRWIEKPEMTVYDTESGSAVGTVEYPQREVHNAVALPGRRVAILARPRNTFKDLGGHVEVRELPSLEIKSHYELTTGLQSNLDCSPGGKYAALEHTEVDLKSGKDLSNHLQIIELSSSQLLHTAVLGPQGEAQVFDVSFSPDGIELGVFLADTNKQTAWIRVWDLSSGATTDHTVPLRIGAQAQKQGHRKLIMQWLPDRQGWLLLDQHIIFRKPGQKGIELSEPGLILGNQLLLRNPKDRGDSLIRGPADWTKPPR